MSAFFQDKIVLVTGAAGFIGSHLCQQLLAEKAYVYGVDNLLTGSKRNFKEFENHPRWMFIEADVIHAPQTYLPSLPSLDCIFHFASPASPPGYQKHPVETYLVNSMGTHQLLQYLVEQFPQARFLFASTSETYGDPLEHPQKETYWGNVNPNGERSMYDESKRLGETICGVHNRSFGIDTRIVRIFNTYGPRMDPNDGRSLVEFVVRTLRTEPISIYGDGSQTRSFCFVSDLVTGVMALMSSSDASGQTVNIGNPAELSMNDLVSTIATLLHKHVPIEYKPSRGDDPKRRCPDISKAKNLLGWRPTVSLDTGLQQTIAYFESLE